MEMGAGPEAYICLTEIASSLFGRCRTSARTVKEPPLRLLVGNIAAVHHCGFAAPSARALEPFRLGTT